MLDGEEKLFNKCKEELSKVNEDAVCSLGSYVENDNLFDID